MSVSYILILGVVVVLLATCWICVMIGILIKRVEYIRKDTENFFNNVEEILNLKKSEELLETISSQQTEFIRLFHNKEQLPQKSSKQKNDIEKDTVLGGSKTSKEEVNFIELTVSDGKLIEPTSVQATYYRTWNRNGKLMYEFFSEKVTKAINNYNAIIEPFCELSKESKLAGGARIIETVSPGILNSDYTINKKTIIKLS